MPDSRESREGLKEKGAMVRSFIAVEVPAEVQDAIAVSLATLKKNLPAPLIRWVASRNMHLTLKFLGDVPAENLKRLADDLDNEARTHEPFDMEVRRLGTFPSPHRPRVIWVGLEAPAGLLALQRGIDSASARLGFPSEERPFSPHLTVGRVGQNVSAAEMQRIRQGLEGTQVGDLGTVQVKAVHIFRSDLRPGGSIYTQLYSLPLKV